MAAVNLFNILTAVRAKLNSFLSSLFWIHFRTKCKESTSAGHLHPAILLIQSGTIDLCTKMHCISQIFQACLAAFMVGMLLCCCCRSDELLLWLCTVLQYGLFAALRNNYWSLIFLQILMIFLFAKQPIWWILDYFSNRNGQNADF